MVSCCPTLRRFAADVKPARSTPRNSAASALSPVSAPKIARLLGVLDRMCKAAVTPEIATTTSLTISVVR